MSRDEVEKVEFRAPVRTRDARGQRRRRRLGRGTLEPAVGTEIGGISITGILGSGGIGSVYAGRDASGRRVAIKILRSRFRDVELELRLGREAELLRSLAHPNIVEVLDCGVDGDYGPYIVMELIEGESLGSYLQRVGKLDYADCLRLLRPVLEAIAFAHDVGVVHRDLNSNNILLARDANGELTAKLIDFGLAKTDAGMGAAITRTSDILGTPIYMAPEQFYAPVATETADIYGIGGILYEALTGEHPLGPIDVLLARSWPQLVIMHENAEPIPIDNLVSLPPAIATAVMRCLRKDPDERFQSVGELVQCLFGGDLGRELQLVFAIEKSRDGWLEGATAMDSIAQLLEELGLEVHCCEAMSIEGVSRNRDLSLSEAASLHRRIVALLRLESGIRGLGIRRLELRLA